MAGQLVYVHHTEYSWVPASLIKQTKKSATVSIAQYKDESEVEGIYDPKKKSDIFTVKLKDYSHGSLPLQNADGGRIKERADMTKLDFLHEAAILFNLKARFIKNKPYTRSGDMIVAVNPFRWLPLYTESIQMTYANSLIWETPNHDPRDDLPPHVYETSALAYKGLSVDCIDQSILVSGESGAGKTETVKIAMNFVAGMVQNHDLGINDTTQDNSIISRVLDSSPLLEAFGNAKTHRNDNSSRFGKYTQLQFSRNVHDKAKLTLAGSTCEVYLLEKSRVIRHDDSERTFHIFHQLCAAADSLKEKFCHQFQGTSYESFSYVGETKTTSIEGISDSQAFLVTIDKLALVGIAGELLRAFIRAVLSVLWIGNLIFVPGPNDLDKSKISSGPALSVLAELLEISEKDLEKALISRTMKVRADETILPLRPEVAKDSADALAKWIYEMIFFWLVRAINAATRADKSRDCEQDFGKIGLLDIFGFESFPWNGFEQLCINYANEQLQAKFTKDIFVNVFEEYESEGISLADIAYNDNTDVLDLIQNRTGLLALLNEECIRPNGSDRGFVNKALHVNKDSPVLITPRITNSDTEFGIRHYAADVMYDASGFVAKNQDTLPTDLMECVRTSSNKIIVEIMQASKENCSAQSKSQRKKSKSNLVSPTVWSKYREQLRFLMTSLGRTRSRYIRCIKPNSFKQPCRMQHSLTLAQLRSGGVISAVTMSRSAFPNSLDHKLVLDRFYPLSVEGSYRYRDQCTLKNQKATESLLLHALKARESGGLRAFVMGSSRVYFRAGALEYLEAELLSALRQPAMMIQAFIRGFIARCQATRLRHQRAAELLELHNINASFIQRFWRCRSAQLLIRQLRQKAQLREKRKADVRRLHRAAIKIQCATRVFVARIEREKRYVKHIRTQAKILKRQKKLKKLDKAATIIQKHVRRYCAREKFGKIIARISIKVHTLDKIAKLQKRIAKLHKLQEKELESVKLDVSKESSSREVWEKSLLAEKQEDGSVSKNARIIESLQSEYRNAQVKMKTLDGINKPLKKKFKSLLKENERFRKDFSDIQDKYEIVKASSKELVARRKAAEKKVGELRIELQRLNSHFKAQSGGRLEFYSALRGIMKIMEKHCQDNKLVEDIGNVVKKAMVDAVLLEDTVDTNRAGIDSSNGKQSKSD